MTKTIDIQVEKSTRLMEALKRHISEVQDKGVSLAGLDKMAEQLKLLEESAKAAEELRAKLSAQVKHTNDILAGCKKAYVETKSIVRDNYPQEKWINYGVMDKR